MKSAVETLDPTRVKMTVEVPFEELKPSLDEAYQQIGSQVQVPGFRKGKVPARIIDQRFGRGTVVQEAVNNALPQLYGEAITENELQPVGQPELNITDIPAEDGQPLNFTVEVDVRPAIDLPETEGIEVEVAAVEVAEEDVNKRLEELRERFGSLVGVDRPAAQGDSVSLDLREEIDGDEIDSVEGISYQIGQGTMLDGLDEQLTGMSAGETGEFSTELAGGDRKGEQAAVTVTVHSVKERELPEVDEEFAQLASQFDTVDELMADLRRQAERNAAFGQGIEARDKILEHLLDQLQIPVPRSLVEAEVEEHLTNENRTNDDEHRAEVTESTERALRSQFLLDALVERDQVEVGQEELLEYIMMSAQQSGMDPNQFIQMLQAQEQIPQVLEEVRRRKALAGVLETAKITDTNGEVVELDELTEDDEGGEDEAAALDAEAESVDSAQAAGLAETGESDGQNAPEADQVPETEDKPSV